MATTICAGFLTGNLWAEDPEAQGIDEDASVQEFARRWEKAILAKYPDAKVNIGWEQASGCKPYWLKTLVLMDDQEDYRVTDRIAEDVDLICQMVFEAGEWYVDAHDEEQ